MDLSRAATQAQKVQMLRDAGPSVVVVTMGKADATGTARNKIQVSVQAQDVQVSDTVGAGDTFNAGFLARICQLGLLDKGMFGTISAEAVCDALSYGNRAAATTVSRRGANPPWPDELAAATKIEVNTLGNP